MAAHTHVAVAVGIPVLHQAPGLGVYASLKESVKDRDFNGIKCFLQVVETHKIHCNPPECAHDPPFPYADLFGWSKPASQFDLGGEILHR